MSRLPRLLHDENADYIRDRSHPIVNTDELTLNVKLRLVGNKTILLSMPFMLAMNGVLIVGVILLIASVLQSLSASPSLAAFNGETLLNLVLFIPSTIALLYVLMGTVEAIKQLFERDPVSSACTRLLTRGRLTTALITRNEEQRIRLSYARNYLSKSAEFHTLHDHNLSVGDKVFLVYYGSMVYIP